MDNKLKIQREIDEREERLKVLREDYVIERIKQNSGRMKFITNLAKMHKSRIEDLKRKVGRE